MALISLVDDRRQWFKAAVGLTVSETPRGIAFCSHAIEQPDVFVVGDASKDERFAANPLVTDDPNLRFYAGAPLKTADGFQLGTLCVLDREARALTPDQLESLSALSRQVMAQLELRLAVRRQAEALVEKDLLMQEVHHRVKNSLTMVRSFLLLQARGAKNQFVGRQLQESAARINTFSAMHEHLYRVGAESEVEISAYLKSLIDDHDTASAATHNGRDIKFASDKVLWPSAEAATVGLIVIELVTNALKYGAGTIAVAFRVIGNEAVLTVEDEGQDLPPTFEPPQSQGLGMRIITGLLQRQNRGRIEIDRSRGHACFVATLFLPDEHGVSRAPDMTF